MRLNCLRLCSVGFVDVGFAYGSLAEPTEVPGTSMGASQHSQKFEVLWRTELTEVPSTAWKSCTRTPGIVAWSYRSHRRPRYGYERHTELTEVPGTGTEVLQNSQKFRVLWHGRIEVTEVPVKYENAVPVPRGLWHGRTEL